MELSPDSGLALNLTATSQADEIEKRRYEKPNTFLRIRFILQSKHIHISAVQFSSIVESLPDF